MTGSDSERPMTRALGTPQRGQTMAPEVERLAMKIFLCYLDSCEGEKDSRVPMTLGLRLKM